MARCFAMENEDSLRYGPGIRLNIGGTVWVFRSLNMKKPAEKGFVNIAATS
jgi:hypothetical protein